MACLGPNLHAMSGQKKAMQKEAVRAMTFDWTRRIFAETLGSAMLVATVVGSGIMADALSADDGTALLGNTLSTGAILVVLITLFGPVSGAHFNPVVSLVFALRRELPWLLAGAYVLGQIVGGIAGCLLANGMFDLPLFQISHKARFGSGQWLGESVATFGLVATILCGVRLRAEAMPVLVGLFITAAYWFTSSTSFANPAVAIARMFSDTFAGIRPADVPIFILAQTAGGLTAMVVVGWLLAPVDKSGHFPLSVDK